MHYRPVQNFLLKSGNGRRVEIKHAIYEALGSELAEEKNLAEHEFKAASPKSNRH